jgi:hypothetical protein
LIDEWNLTASVGSIDLGKSSKGQKKRRRGDVAEATNGYMQQNSNADYFETLYDLHARGYRVNRHGNGALMGLWLKAKADVQEERC